ncbi:MAG: hypothetical protein CVV17_02945 [Gammaproteobacteria bacterium HGW-Gammaproteobacteria-7]|nr:MAG: hypothetical protein CVV17_02945 [Gammaproteobacteria bacterium HGW-Gammaproteobacteria-7]
MNPSTHRADPGYRRAVRIALVASIVLGAALSLGLYYWLDSLFAPGGETPPETLLVSLRLLLVGLCLMLALPLLALAGWLHRQAIRISAQRRYPLPDTRTLTDMPVREGEAALAQAKTHVRLAWLCVALAAALMLWAVWSWLAF